MKIKLIDKDSPFVTALVSGWEFWHKLVMQGEINQSVAESLCNKKELLAEVVNMCFWSSIILEENRAVRGIICICSPDNTQLSRAFLVPVSATVKNIVSLLTASPGSSLAIHESENGLVIWGLLDSIDLYALKIRIAGTGVIVASVCQNVLAVLQCGEVHIPKYAEGTDWIKLTAKVVHPNKSIRDSLEIISPFLKVVTSIQAQGHGGALVVVPSSLSTWKEFVHFAFQFDALGSLAFKYRYLNCVEAEMIYKKDLEDLAAVPAISLGLHKQIADHHSNLLDMTLHSIGDLSAIDGAIITDENLKVFGFGAKLLAKSIDFQIIDLDLLSGNSEEISYTQLGGMRHQSAARFVNQFNEALIFVISQDGKLTLFVWMSESGNTVAIRGLEHFIWEFHL